MITLALANKKNMVVKWIHVEISKEQLPSMESTGELNSHCLQPLRCGYFLDRILSGILLLLLIPKVTIRKK